MAGIDKTYTNSYTEYKEFRDWSKKQTVIFFDGHSQCIGDWVWDLEEVDFGEKEIPIMNTPSWQYRDWETDRKSTRLNSSHSAKSRMPSSA